MYILKTTSRFIYIKLQQEKHPDKYGITICTYVCKKNQDAIIIHEEIKKKEEKMEFHFLMSDFQLNRMNYYKPNNEIFIHTYGHTKVSKISVTKVKNCANTYSQVENPNVFWLIDKPNKMKFDTNIPLVHS